MRARKIIKKINTGSHYVSGVALLALMVLTVVDVLGRLLFDKRLAGTFELTSMFLVFIVFFALAYANDHHEHVVIDVLYNLFPRMGKKVISYVSTVISMVIVALMCWQVFSYGIQLISRNATTSTLHIPMWPIVMLGGVGMLGYLLSTIGDVIFVAKGGVMGDDDD